MYQTHVKHVLYTLDTQDGMLPRGTTRLPLNVELSQ
jgi:hypothetical protein